MTRPAVFLDRDGVLNAAHVRDGRPYPPRDVSELELLPGVEAACAQMRAAGLALVCVTNQPDIARGTTDSEAVGALNREVAARLGLDAVEMCPHDDADGCDCRKPMPGLLIRAARDYHLDLARSVIVGDRWRDVEAGRRAGVRTVYVDAGYSADPRPARADLVVRDLPEALEWIMDQTTSTATITPPLTASDLRVKLFADGADLQSIIELAGNPLISGFTTNPTLMRKAGVTDYEAFARALLSAVPDRPISFEVFSDEPAEMERQATRMASWAENVYVKVPVTNTRGERSDSVIRRLAGVGVKVNVTALFTTEQVRWVTDCLAPDVPAYVSLFAGRIADSGRDPGPHVRAAVDVIRSKPLAELIWASPREVLNVIQADEAGCHIITATSDVLAKLGMLGKDLDEFSLDTVRMFHRDAASAGYRV